MNLFENCSIVLVSVFGFLMFWIFGVPFLVALLLGIIIYLLGSSTLNYLNHGKFQPYVSHSSNNR